MSKERSISRRRESSAGSYSRRGKRSGLRNFQFSKKDLGYFISPPVSHSPGLAGIFLNGLLLPYWFYNLILCKYKLYCQGRPWKPLCWLFLIICTDNYSNKKTNNYYLMSIYHETHIVLSA